MSEDYQPGDSVVADDGCLERSGTVVRVYADGTLAVIWDGEWNVATVVASEVRPL